jgi:hypothetical protein
MSVDESNIITHPLKIPTIIMDVITTVIGFFLALFDLMNS